MKSYFFTFILTVLFLASAFTASFAQVSWTKDINNPVLTNGPAGSWDEHDVWAPSVLFHNNEYHMWYGSFVDGIGHATSADGINWQRDTLNPVLVKGLPGSWEDNDITAPMVIVVNDTFHMWYTGHSVPANNAGFLIGHATSVYGSMWVKDTLNPVLGKGSSGTWDNVWVYGASVVFDGSAYHLWYSAWDGNLNPARVRIGHATSPDPNGRNWTKDPANPVLIPEPSFAWEHNRVEGSNVLFDGSTFHMWYTAGQIWLNQIGYATSQDGSNWSRYPNNPVLPDGQAGEWDDSAVYWPSVIFSDSLYKMWYSGYNGVKTQIGYATALVTALEEIDFKRYPEGFALSQNYPNPFNPTTTFEFSIPKTEFVTLKIYNLLGQEVEELVAKRLTAGSYKYSWNASSFASGVYYYKLESGNRFVQSKKLVLLR